MVLSDLEIRNLIQSGSVLISPFDESRLQGASYDLSLSDSISVIETRSQTLSLADQENIDSIYKTVTLSESGYALQPGEYILAQVVEQLKIPVDMAAHIRPRTRFTRLGLLLAAQHCNPGYSGTLSLGLYNASPNAVILAPGLHIAQVVFEQLTSAASEEKQYQNKKNASYMDEQKFRGANFEGSELSPEAQKIYESMRKKLFED